ncbi:GMC family oxidoreductase [Rubellimicrobium sp. CFH 75288]|uniref:GMC family oxidoreductase n=1 Tax=Rubellimicrobium sp. CFH 75288 TaxID=2697034 RepID=UPI00141262C6|nr:GMC family oxidoreductase N-terminal domain-containing protein [Rubellimicrobium sp. CFH 75288]NAZ35262.1 FAD-binding protein [Rubellimicrobium sp. CFH 75288]
MDAIAQGEWDIIIVGAGSAGCALAWRLSADPRLRVLVVEAGGTDRRLFVQMPLGYGKLFHDPRVNWCFRAEPDPGLAGVADHWPRGRLLGGSSSINAMVWIRGHPGDYEDWAEAAGSFWGWPEALAAFRALEDWEGGADEWHGTGGPLHVSTGARDPHPLVRRAIAAAQAAGLPFNPDFNGASLEGVGFYPMTIRGGRRNSAARAFLRPAMRRGRVAVMTRAQATRLLWDGHRCTGVEVVRRGRILHLRAAREVVLSAGAVGTPQILMLSGVGDGAALAALGLPVLHHNPQVGRNLCDHQGLNYTWRMRVPTYNQVLRPWWGKGLAGARWLLSGRGPLAFSINHGGGFFRTDPGRNRPNMQLYIQAFSTLIPRAGERPVLSPDPFPGMSLGLSNCRPTSRGEIALRTPDPLAPPRITVNALSSDEDIREMLDGVRMLRRIAAQPPFAEVVAEELRPGPAVATEEALVADIRARSGTVYHPSCTARMGRDPARSVLAPDLTVRGVEGLRVADASAFPTLPGGNTNAPAILVGWKAGDLILSRRAA